LTTLAVTTQYKANTECSWFDSNQKCSEPLADEAYIYCHK